MKFFGRQLNVLLISVLFGFFFPASAQAEELFLPADDLIISLAAHMVLFVSFLYLIHFIAKTAEEAKNWRYIRLSLIFFAIWSFQHMAEQILEDSMIPRADYFHGDYLIIKSPLSVIFYFLKFTRTINRLIAVVFFYFGLRHLRMSEENKDHV